MSLEQLQRFCSDDEGRPVLRAPYSFEHAGEMWSVGTDGLRMLAIRARLVDPRAEAPNAAHILTIVDGWRLIFMPLRQDSADLKAKMPRSPLASESVVAIPDSGRGAA